MDRKTYTLRSYLMLFILILGALPAQGADKFKSCEDAVRAAGEGVSYEELSGKAVSPETLAGVESDPVRRMIRDLGQMRAAIGPTLEQAGQREFVSGEAQTKLKKLVVDNPEWFAYGIAADGKMRTVDLMNLDNRLWTQISILNHLRTYETQLSATGSPTQAKIAADAQNPTQASEKDIRAAWKLAKEKLEFGLLSPDQEKFLRTYVERAEGKPVAPALSEYLKNLGPISTHR